MEAGAESWSCLRPLRARGGSASGPARRAKPGDAMILTRFVHVEPLPVEPMLPRMAPGRVSFIRGEGQNGNQEARGLARLDYRFIDE
jgi:hypothetical protein